MPDIYDIFAKNLRSRRCELGLTQAMLGDMIHYSEKSISKWESGAAIPNIDILLKLTQILGTDLNTLLGFDNRTSFFLGIDGSPSKTVFALANESGHVIRTCSAGSCNPAIVGMREAENVLEKGIEEICNGISYQRIAAFAGIFSDVSAKERSSIEEFLGKFNFNQCNTASEEDNALAAALHGEDGVAVIIGNENSIYAVDNGITNKFGGYGYLFDNGGSSFNIGRECIRAAISALDGSGPKTALTSLIENRIGESVRNRLGDFYQREREYISTFSPLVFEAYSAGDKVAASIIEKCFSVLALRIESAIRSRTAETEYVSLIGELTEFEERIRPVLKATLGNIKLVFCKTPAVLGALMLAGAPVFKNDEYKTFTVQ